jgi:hypothetical protein
MRLSFGKQHFAILHIRCCLSEETYAKRSIMPSFVCNMLPQISSRCLQDSEKNTGSTKAHLVSCALYQVADRSRATSGYDLISSRVERGGSPFIQTLTFSSMTNSKTIGFFESRFSRRLPNIVSICCCQMLAIASWKKIR